MLTPEGRELHLSFVPAVFGGGYADDLAEDAIEAGFVPEATFDGDGNDGVISVREESFCILDAQFVYEISEADARNGGEASGHVFGTAADGFGNGNDGNVLLIMLGNVEKHFGKSVDMLRLFRYTGDA